MILGSATYTVSRYTGGSWSGGFRNRGALSTHTINGSVQPLDEDTLFLLPEAAREQARWIFLFDYGDLILSDTITVGTADYLVTSFQDWTYHAALPYKAAVLSEVTQS